MVWICFSVQSLCVTTKRESVWCLNYIEHYKSWHIENTKKYTKKNKKKQDYNLKKRKNVNKLYENKQEKYKAK